ncbi:hypothetical protein NDU88_006123 [Pleurodeles waltl]|uniref:Uncharacterized protein n=1 Tax=Pleurodeles waltl TaxID=8319 RepID=A0AAV7L6T0_PLEWA|nr:hypothetical protein NDU88_006123 [Pleurodeles waltl]
MRITKARALCTRDEDHKDTVRSALKSCEAQGHGPLRTQELRIIRTRSVVHSNAVVHKDTMRNALKICGSHGHCA